MRSFYNHDSLSNQQNSEFGNFNSHLSNCVFFPTKQFLPGKELLNAHNWLLWFKTQFQPYQQNQKDQKIETTTLPFLGCDHFLSFFSFLFLFLFRNERRKLLMGNQMWWNLRFSTRSFPLPFFAPAVGGQIKSSQPFFVVSFSTYFLSASAGGVKLLHEFISAQFSVYIFADFCRFWGKSNFSSFRGLKTWKGDFLIQDPGQRSPLISLVLAAPCKLTSFSKQLKPVDFSSKFSHFRGN